MLAKLRGSGALPFALGWLLASLMMRDEPSLIPQWRIAGLCTLLALCALIVVRLVLDKLYERRRRKNTNH